MTESTQVTLLRRMTRTQGQEVAENPLTSSRAVRLALTKAANDTVGLVLTVQSVAEEVTGLDDMLGTLADELMLVGLERDGCLSGLIALDMEMRAAVIERETMGAVLAHPAEPRFPTLTDKMLCDPLMQGFLMAFPAAVMDTPLQGWLDDVDLGRKIDSTRAAGLLLEDRDYRIVRLSVDLGVAERQAELVIALPVMQDIAETEVLPDAVVDWGAGFQENVSDAPACLRALLHRFPISLATAQALEVGSVLPLPGCTVSSVRLMSPDGEEVTQAKLGQVGGYRAVRLEAAPAAQLAELPSTVANMPLAEPMDLVVADVNVVADISKPADSPEIEEGPGSLMYEPAQAASDIDQTLQAMPEVADLPIDLDTD